MEILKAIGIIFLGLLVICLYLLPWIIAYDRNSKKKDLILYSNIFIGWLLGAAYGMESKYIPIALFILFWLALNCWAYFDKKVIEEDVNPESSDNSASTSPPNT
jgi:T4 superinfection immunity protein